MKLDRELQKMILEKLAEVYPDEIFEVAPVFPESDRGAVFFNLQYLAEHGLINSGVRKSQSGDADDQWYELGTKITAAGLDFLADDGGPGAILTAGSTSK
ncbi:hypothetical protein BH11PSE11_BH11PSE11_22150 [soil metagenome]